jgi:transposase
VPAVPPYIIEPIFQQFRALLPERKTSHPLGCHRPRIPDRVVFEKLVQVLVFGCAYEKIADGSCSATTLRDRRDEWIELGGDRAAARDDARSLRSGHRPGSLGAGGRLLHHESALRGREGRKEPGGPWQAGPQAFGGR